MKLYVNLRALKRAAFVTLCCSPFITKAQNTFPTTTGGNAGVGTTAPITEFQVSGNSKPFLMIAPFSYTSSPTVLTSLGGIIFNQENMDKSAAIQGAVPAGWHVPGILFSTKTSWDMPGPGMKDWYNRMFIHPGGDVGIGTITPGETFNSNQAGFPSYTAADRVLSVASPNLPVLELNRSNTTANGAKIGAIYFTNTANQGDAHLQVAGVWAENVSNPAYTGGSGSKLVFMTKQLGVGTQHNMTFDETGNLSIGTSNSKGYKLAVDGTVGARKVKVSQESWADFVFEPGYRLPSLPELERYVREHKHLPGIPSAQEVSENGIDIGEMNKVLLQKVEEQALYIIDLNKKLEALAEQVKQLQTSR